MAKLAGLLTLSVILFSGTQSAPGSAGNANPLTEERKPNILFVISDDQSYPHASAYGYKAVSTPAFDRIAREGVLFTNAFSASPGCSPSRAAILTGKNCWQLEHAGTHASSFSASLKTYPDRLEEVGYFIGFTGKGWGPGDFKVSGRSRNPAGPAFNGQTMEAPKGISTNDYAANFNKFLADKPAGKPFCFWFGAQEPHRRYPTGIGKQSGMDMTKVQVPGFLPDHPAIKSDLLDYLYEIQWYDRHLGRIIKMLEEAGELDNTLIVVTSDNGMPFPRAKANVYEYGIHLPLAIRWGNRVKGNRTVADPVSLMDLAPTFLEAAGVPFDAGDIRGRSLLNILTSSGQGIVDKSRDAVYASRERHSSSRWNNLGYPQRCIRTRTHLYIWNVKPDRWPAGDPQVYDEQGKLGKMDHAYFDIDDFNESYIFLQRQKPEVAPYFHWAVDKRPEEELYDIVKDPACLTNLAGKPTHQKIRQALSTRLKSYLTETNDPRMGSNGEIFETYKRYSPLRTFPSPQ
ncbi:sulfatase family protein [Larkinella punicea]|uniref:sulfatase family protein n=1 Tax=Larkinella punicea TaxID=2315727 RepID=UPI001E6374BF|nr:sulfatase [Larkinella punicea]